MHPSSHPLMQIEATEALLEALAKLSSAAPDAMLSSDEAFEIAALKFLTARALQVVARSSERPALFEQPPVSPK